MIISNKGYEMKEAVVSSLIEHVHIAIKAGNNRQKNGHINRVLHI